MKLLRSFFFASVLLFVGTACERHPASQTLSEHKQNHPVTTEQSLVPAAHAPQFFHPEKKAAEAPAAVE